MDQQLWDSLPDVIKNLYTDTSSITSIIIKEDNIRIFKDDSTFDLWHKSPRKDWRLIKTAIPHFNIDPNDGRLIVKFNYLSSKRESSSPRVLLLGNYIHPKTGNSLICGINLEYLDEDDKRELNKYLDEICDAVDLSTKTWKLQYHCPDIYQKAYRSYNEENISMLEIDDVLNG